MELEIIYFIILFFIINAFWVLLTGIVLYELVIKLKEIKKRKRITKK